MIWDLAFISKKYLIYLPYKTKGKTVQKQLVKDICASTAWCCLHPWKTTHCLLGMPHFIMPQFHSSSDPIVLAFNYHPLIRSSNSSSWAFLLQSQQSKPTTQSPPCTSRPPCTSHPPVLCLPGISGLRLQSLYRTSILLQPQPQLPSGEPVLGSQCKYPYGMWTW